MDDPYRDAMGIALRKLKSKDLFEAEVRRFLAEFAPEVVDRVIRFLKDRRIIDDTKTTQNLIERNTGKRSIGSEKIRAKLVERGAPEETVDAILGDRAGNEAAAMFEALSAKIKPK